MSLKYHLAKNLLKTSKEDLLARPAEIKSHDLESIIELMLQQGSTITRADILAVLTSFFETTSHITANGETINTELFKTRFSISGVFASSTESFDKLRHHIKVNMSPGKMLKDTIAQIKVEKVTVSPAAPHILEVKDSLTGSLNDIISSNGILEIIGSLLKIEGTDPRNGIFFIAGDGVKSKVTTIVENKPSKLIVSIPTLAMGRTYQLQLVTQYGGGASLKSPRTGTYSNSLRVL